jgi:hypothetical protein
MNGPRTARDRKKIYERIQVGERHDCWIWQGPLNKYSGRPMKQFSVGGDGYSVQIAPYMYQEAFKTNLGRNDLFHFCPKSDYCVSPLHNFPSADCDCERCLARRARGLSRVKEETLWRFVYEPAGQPAYQAFFSREIAARLFVRRFLRALGAPASEDWRLEEHIMNPVFSEVVANEPSPRILLGAS